MNQPIMVTIPLVSRHVPSNEISTQSNSKKSTITNTNSMILCLKHRLRRDIESNGILSVKDLKKLCLLKSPQDRPQRQRGGETKALHVLHSFLTHRGELYNEGISSPNSSWTSCSRLRYIDILSRNDICQMKIN